MRFAHLIPAIAILACFSAAAQESLSVIALRDWYSGITVDGHTETGAPFRAFHAQDGKINALYDGQHKNSGTWKLQEPGHVCVSWADATWGKNPCFVVHKDADFWKLVRVDNAKIFVRVKRIEGNPFGLQH